MLSCPEQNFMSILEQIIHQRKTIEARVSLEETLELREELRVLRWVEGLFVPLEGRTRKREARRPLAPLSVIVCKAEPQHCFCGETAIGLTTYRDARCARHNIPSEPIVSFFPTHENLD